MSRLALAAMLLATSAQARAELLDAGAVAANYRSLQTYCDEVAVSNIRGLPDALFRRCFAADGRFKIHQFSKDGGGVEAVSWGDRDRQYFWSGRPKGWRGMVTTRYSEDPRHSPPPWVDDVLRVFWLNGLAGFEGDPACAADSRCYARSMAGKDGSVVGTERVWLRASDGLITRFERRWNDGNSFSADVTSLRVNDAGRADFRHAGPLLYRAWHSYSARPKTFLAALLVGSFAAGFVPWLMLDLLRLRAGAPLALHRRLWRIHAWIALACAVPCVALTLAMIDEDGGHPPPIYFALVVDLAVGYGLVCVGALLAGVHLARKEALRRFSSAPWAPRA